MAAMRCATPTVWKSSLWWEGAESMAAGTHASDAQLGDRLRVGTHTLTSRLIVGTGKYASYELMADALDVSGTDCITVAVRRERLVNSAGQNILDFIDTRRYTLLPNTAGCF